MKKQLILGVIAIVVVIILILFVLLVIFGSNNDNCCKVDNDETLDSRFFGEWKTDYEFQEGEPEITYVFNSNGTFSIKYSGETQGSAYIGIWFVEDNQFCITREGYEKECYRFEFSNNDEIFTSYDNENNPIVYNKQ